MDVINKIISRVKKPENRKYLVKTLLIMLALVLILPAIFNGYPMVHSDSGTYITAGYKNNIPVDRPIIYCLFVRYSSLSLSLWFVLIFQALIVSFVIYMVTRKFAAGNTLLISTIIMVVLSVTTGLSIYASQIMPDIFSSLTIIGFAVLIITDKMRWKEYLLTAIVVFGAMTNFSYFIILAGLVVICFIMMLLRFVSPRIFVRGAIITLLPFVLILSVNKAYTGKFQVSRAGNVFIIARMIETGVVKQFLLENCGKKHYIFCSEIDSLPESTCGFLWNDKSPLYYGKHKPEHWDLCWDNKNEAFGTLIKDIVTTPAYCKELSTIYAKDFLKQVFDFNIGILTPQRKNSSPQTCIEDRFENEIDSYTSTKQYENTLEFKDMSWIQFVMVIISLLVTTTILFLHKKLKIKKEHFVLIFILIMGILGNALTVTIFSAVVDRYQARIIWVIPLIGLLMTYKYIVEKKMVRSSKGDSK